MRYFLAFIFISSFLFACNINRNVMFKTDRDYVYDSLYIDSSDVEYRIAPNDLITFLLFTNEGARILEFTAGSGDKPQYFSFQDFTYPITPDGMCELPAIGLVKLAGLTIYEAQTLVEELYTFQFNFPFAIIKVVNHRVIVFPGTGSDAKVIPLNNKNTTILEAIASAGGLSQRADARKVKLIRNENNEDKVYLMDLSTIEGIQYAQMNVKTGDVIYVEPTPELASEALRDLTPYVSIISSIALIYAIITKGF